MAFSEVMSDISNHGKYSLSLYDMGRYMRLDAAAQRALNVMKTKFDANDNFSLYGLMSRARTSMGKRLLKASVINFWLWPLPEQFVDCPMWHHCLQLLSCFVFRYMGAVN